jgi:uncharacterized membrane protein
MPHVSTTVWIDAPLERVYAIARDAPSFPEIMDDVQSVTILEREGERVVSDWVGLIPTFRLKIKWRQEDLWDDVAHICRFRQLEGDYDSLSGTWAFTEENGGTRFVTELDYEYNVPTLGPLVKKVIYSLVVKNREGINKAFKTKAEQK